MNKEIKRILNKRSSQLLQSDKTLADIFDITFSDAELVMCETNDGFRIRSCTYGDIKARVQNTAAALYDRVGACHTYIAVELDNSDMWIVGFWATLMSGNKPYLVNLRYPDSLTNGILKTLDVHYIISDGVGTLEGEYIDINTLSGGKTPPRDVFENELAFSSSATSMNEVVCFYTGAQIAAQILNFKGIVRQNPDIAAHHNGVLRQLAFLPFYHIFGLFAVYFWFSFFGRAFVFLRDYSSETILKTCKKHKVTHIFAVPVLWHTLADSITAQVAQKDEKTQKKFEKGIKILTSLQNVFPRLGRCIARRAMREVTDKTFGNSIKFLINGGSYIRPQAMRLINAVGYPLYNGYGMSEIGITSVELRNKPMYRNLCSIGRPFDSVQYRINGDGVLQVKTPSLCVRKLVNGKEASADGWFDTDDKMREQDGCYFIDGRVSDIVIGQNGENINPDTVEQLFVIPGVHALSVLGLDTGDGEQLSAIMQISRYASQATVSRIRDTAYAINQTLPAATAVSRFYFTADELVSGKAIKVSRRQLKRRISENEVVLTPFSDMQGADSADGDSYLLKDVISVIADVLGISEDEISVASHIFFDLGATSIQYFSILSALSDKFSVDAYQNTDSFYYTPIDICRFLERYL